MVISFRKWFLSSIFPKCFTFSLLMFNARPLWSWCLYAVNDGDQLLPPLIKHLTLVLGSSVHLLMCVLNALALYKTAALSCTFSICSNQNYVNQDLQKIPGQWLSSIFDILPWFSHLSCTCHLRISVIFLPV